MRILIKFATRGRPQKFRQAMDNIRMTIGTDDYLVIVSIDNDDETMMPLLGEINTMKNTQGYAGKPNGKIAAINRDMNPYEPWDILVNLSDDMFFTANNWGLIIQREIRDVFKGSLDCFLHFSDGWVNEKLPTMSIMGREYYERFFYIYAPCYKSVSCDAEAFYVAITLDKHHYFPERIFEHRHPVNVKGNYDQTYKTNDQWQDQDTATYFKRMSKNFYVHNPGKTVFDQFKR